MVRLDRSLETRLMLCGADLCVLAMCYQWSREQTVVGVLHAASTKLGESVAREIDGDAG